MGRRLLKMISNIVKPSKSELVRKIQSLRNTQIDSFEIIDENSKRDVSKKLDTELRKGIFSIILIRE